MPNAHQSSLFMKHAEDLNFVCDVKEELFICPICLKIFRRIDLNNGHMDVGHVWPSFLRQNSDVAKHQHVLLCKKCNSLAGMHADAEMQQYERILEGVQTDLSIRPGVVHVFLPTRPDLRPIRVRGTVQNAGAPNQLNIIFEDTKSERQKANYQEILTRINQYMQQGPISVAFESPINARLAQVGWLTSAYLLAFYTFGYRYILQKCLNIARGQILQSFEKKASLGELLKPEVGKDMLVGRSDEYYYTDPEIGLFLAIRREIPHHIQINYRNVEARLPIPQMPASLQWPPIPNGVDGGFINANNPDVSENLHWSIIFGESSWVIKNHTLVERST